MTFKVTKFGKPRIKDPILISGLPGIGNVGKVATDFMIENLKAKKVFEISSKSFPHAVFVNEENLIDLPTIDIYYKKLKNRDYLFLSGDIQPIDEAACYEFCDKVLDVLEEHKGKEIITLGGIGLKKVPNEPRVFCTGNDKKRLSKLKGKKLNKKIYGFVGPIIGVSGLLPGLAKKRSIPATVLLAETFGHPNYLGIKGAKEILEILNSNLKMDMKLDSLSEEIGELEEEIKKRAQAVKKVEKLQKIKKKKVEIPDEEDLSYIG